VIGMLLIPDASVGLWVGAGRVSDPTAVSVGVPRVGKNIRTLAGTPELTHDPSTYAGWRSVIGVALQLADCWNAALGLDFEPTSARWMDRVIEQRETTAEETSATSTEATTTEARNVRAGSTMPSAEETESLVPMLSEQRKEWFQWQKRESKAQAILKASVSPSVQLDLQDMLSAANMWKFCEKLRALNIVENQREVRRKLYPLDLREDAPAEEMAAHVETLSKLLMEGRLVGINHTSFERGRETGFG
jgi:hypothetical protein